MVISMHFLPSLRTPGLSTFTLISHTFGTKLSVKEFEDMARKYLLETWLSQRSRLIFLKETMN